MPTPVTSKVIKDYCNELITGKIQRTKEQKQRQNLSKNFKKFESEKRGNLTKIKKIRFLSQNTDSSFITASSLSGGLSCLILK
ncbi:hypothetical protein X975_26720, partial [Stegodyphus mimosarum]